MSLDQITEFAWKVANFLLTITGAGAIIALLYGAFLYLISAGDTFKVKTAHQTILWSLVGIITIFSAKTIIRIECDVLNIPDCDSEQLTITPISPPPIQPHLLLLPRHPHQPPPHHNLLP